MSFFKRPLSEPTRLSDAGGSLVVAAPPPARIPVAATPRPAPPPAIIATSAPVPAVAASAAAATAGGDIAGLLGELVQNGKLSLAKATDVADEAQRMGRTPYEVLLHRNLVPRGDLYAAVERLPAVLRQRIGMLLRTAADLPEWDKVLNDADGPLGNTTRDPAVVALATGEDIARAARVGEKPACFLLATAYAAKGVGYSALVGRILKNGYSIRARLPLASQAIADVVWAQWDERRGKKEGGRVAGGASSMQKLFDTIGRDGYSKGASDIHIVSRGGAGQILFRVDGDVLRQPYDLTGPEALSLCSTVYDTLTETSSVKEGFSQISLQDGSVDRAYDDFRLRFRYAGEPIEPNGYHVAMRIIPIGTHSRPKTLDALGYAESQQTQINRGFSRSSGLVLFCGTTGSGKSTTEANRLRTLIAEHPTKMVLTVEEPVEYIIDGAYQHAVLRKEGQDGQTAFQHALRSIMRLDPDVLMLGEIRDLETADMALQGVRSGHLLISTLHSDAAPSCYDRLAGLGIHRGDMAAMDLVAGFVFQALVQTLCTHCRVPARSYISTNDPTLKGLMWRLRTALDSGVVPGAQTTGDGLDGIFFRNSVGCAHCDQRGITGRTVCAEVFQPTADALHAVKHGDSKELWDWWRSHINKTDAADMTGRRAIEHAMWKMARGIVSPAQVESQFRLLDEPIF